jgi:hypothetical protein
VPAVPRQEAALEARDGTAVGGPHAAQSSTRLVVKLRA